MEPSRCSVDFTFMYFSNDMTDLESLDDDSGLPNEVPQPLSMLLLDPDVPGCVSMAWELEIYSSAQLAGPIFNWSALHFQQYLTSSNLCRAHAAKSKKKSKLG